MDPFIRKHWSSLLGIAFVLAAFVTLFRFSVDQGWITDVLKIGFGLLCGLALGVSGLALFKKGVSVFVSQIVLGLGACILYATFSFAGIYYGIWSPMTVLIGMTAVTAGASAFAYRYDSRLLMNIALAGGLLSPLMMRPETDQVFTLFLYAFVLNAAFFFLSIAKGWGELRSHAFVGTWIVYGVYYVHFDPPTDGLWSMPIRYAVAAFLFYAIGFLLSSWKNNRCFDGWNLYLGLANGVLFGCWAAYILHGQLDYGFVLVAIGTTFLSSAAIIFKSTGRIDAASASHALGAALLYLLSLSRIGNGLDAEPIVNVFVWGAISAALYQIGLVKKWPLAKLMAGFVWLIVGSYWFAVTWTTTRGDWFGAFVPFLNWGAMAWILLAAIGFRFAMQGKSAGREDGLSKLISHGFALLSHLIVGGLLTVQIQNVFEVYFHTSESMKLSLALSVSWGVYALLLILWGAYRKQPVFRWFGSAVLLLVAAKAAFMDLEGEDALYKAVVLLVLGGISFLISWVNGKWAAAETPAITDKSEEASAEGQA